MRSSLFAFVLGTVAVVATSIPAQAALIVYTATWSGAELGNSATATAAITVDTSLLSNPGNNSLFTPPGSPGEAITNVVLTVSGANSGNGTFTNADFAFYVFNWNSALDLNSELVGQPQSTGGPWGTHEGQTGFNGSHDFNLFGATLGAPNGTFYYQLTTNGGLGDSLYLTSFAPSVAAVPEPATAVMLGSLAVAAFGLRRRRDPKA